jgi:formylmethanofuran dehydrogenase subunit B
MIIASDPGAHFPGAALRHLAKIPTIQIDPFPNPTTEFADVVIPAAISGIESAGGVYRMDNVPLRLRKIIETDYYISDEEIVKKIHAEVRALREKEGE